VPDAVEPPCVPGQQAVSIDVPSLALGATTLSAAAPGLTTADATLSVGGTAPLSLALATVLAVPIYDAEIAGWVAIQLLATRVRRQRPRAPWSCG